jgi:hypothetical protein
MLGHKRARSDTLTEEQLSQLATAEVDMAVDTEHTNKKQRTVSIPAYTAIPKSPESDTTEIHCHSQDTEPYNYDLEVIVEETEEESGGNSDIEGQGTKESSSSYKLPRFDSQTSWPQGSMTHDFKNAEGFRAPDSPDLFDSTEAAESEPVKSSSPLPDWPILRDSRGNPINNDDGDQEELTFLELLSSMTSIFQEDQPPPTDTHNFVVGPSGEHLDLTCDESLPPPSEI